LRLGLLAFAALLISSAAAAQSIEAEGIAALDAGGMEQARQEAIQDALQQAAMSAAAQVEASSDMDSSGKLQESVRVTPAASISSHTVLQEWSADGLLHVRIRAEVQPQEGAPTGAGQKAAVRTPNFKKKIAVTRFHVVNSLQVEDISNIWDGYPLELLRRLELLGNVLPVNNISSLLSAGSEPIIDSPANREMIRRIAEQTGSQFVISGVILDAGFGGGTIRPYWGWQGKESGIRSEIALPWPNLAVGLKPGPSERRLEVEIFLHDGLSGALISRHRASAEADGRVTVGRDKPFASAAFFATPFGHVAERLIDTQVEAISNDLACLPFMASIVRIQGRKVFLDAGGTSGLAPGARLTVYRKNTNAPISSLSGATTLGIPETSATTVTLREVQPLFALGELAADPAKVNVQIGDVARFEAARAGK
jgi:hypothetical protein